MSGEQPVTLDYTSEGTVAQIVLNRPEKMNALSDALLKGLHSAVTEIEGSDQVRVVTVRGAGSNFSAGGDLQNLLDAIETEDHDAIAEFLESVDDGINGLADLTVPVIAIVEGFALAGGIEILLACDMAIASEEASIGDQHANYGLLGGGGSTQRLPRAIGPRRAKELILTGNRISGGEAAEIGLVNRAVPPEELDAASVEFVEEIASKGRETTIQGNRLMDVAAETDLEAGLEIERRQLQSHLFSSDAHEGLTAFNEGRTPEF
jgi:enoyl-CoA hydratase